MNLNNYWSQIENEKSLGLESLCCGCGACSQICPKGAIKINMNNEGFYQPVIDENKCIDCGICVAKCQHLSKKGVITTYEKPKVYVAAIKDINNLKRSSSGGIAFALAEYILDNNGIVFGSVYDENMEVVHKIVESKTELWKLQGSKYVQSRIGNTYKQAENCLKNGKCVLFTGTPCQIGGLYQFLGKDYPNLYTMDIICYGASSPGVFRDYIIWKEKKTKGKINYINFRSKLDRWGVAVTEIIYDNRKKLVKYSVDDEWYQVFISHVATNNACHYCKYTNLQRMSDISVGDFWGIEKFKPELESKNGLSKVLLNTDKGRMLFNEIDVWMTKDEMEVISAIRPNLQQPPLINEKRYMFFKDYTNGGFLLAFKKHVRNKDSIKRRIKRWIKIKFLSRSGI